MKKQIFLLSLTLLSAGVLSAACCGTTSSSSSSCCTTSTTACCTSNTSSSCNSCQQEWGHTYLQVTPHFQAASPELTSCFNSNVLYNLDHEDKHGAFEVAVFGGRNTKQNRAAAYFLPYGNESLTFDGSVTAGTNLHAFARVLGESAAQATGATTTGDQIFFGGEISTNANFLRSDAATYNMDTNKDTSKILPWNFGITFAALFEPLGLSSASAGTSGINNLVGSGLVTSPAFKSTICPSWSYSHVGVGLALRYQFSEDKQGFFGVISTAVQNVKSCFKLNETVETEITEINPTNFPERNPVLSTALTIVQAYNSNGTNGLSQAAGSIYGNAVLTTTATPATNGLNPVLAATDTTNGISSIAPTGSIYEAYILDKDDGETGTGFPIGTSAPANATEAFAQAAWNYGKVSPCAQKITRLADIELSLGYQWFCGDCGSTNWYVGLVIPTGNKPCATYIAPAVVGNGAHVGIMTGSCTELMLSDGPDYSSWYRMDMSWRYLFRNTQKRSFDLEGNSWSRYMMVWPNKAAYTAAVTAANTLNSITYTTSGAKSYGVAQHGYEPGINVFTTDFYIKPQFQGRINQAVYFQAEHFRAELGWNIFARQKDCVQLACDWTAAPAFADASYVGGMGLNNDRTIYNDSQTTCYNAVDTLFRTNTTALITLATDVLADTDYADFAISSDLIDYDSVATPNAIVNTPYLVLGYAFESDYKPQLSIGGSYEFTTRNSTLNQWLVWGKFELAF
jgi:hypothetical protein